MKRYLLALVLLFIPLFAYAAVDTVDGTTVTTANSFDGVSGVDTIDGQTIKSGAASPTTVVFGGFTTAALDCDAGTTNTSIVCAACSGGSDGASTLGYNSWIGFKVTAGGTGSGTALVTGWDDGTDTLTVGTGLSGMDADSTVTISAYYTTVLDTWVAYGDSTPNGADTNLENEYDTSTPIYENMLGYIPLVESIGESKTINSAYFAAYVPLSYLSASRTWYIGQVVADDMWTEAQATYAYLNQSTTTDWVAAAGNDVTDVFSATEDTFEVDGTDGTYKYVEITNIVSAWAGGATNQGFYTRGEDTDTAHKFYFHARDKDDATVHGLGRWFIVVTYQ